jgi:hypothetical protein
MRLSGRPGNCAQRGLRGRKGPSSRERSETPKRGVEDERRHEQARHPCKRNARGEITGEAPQKEQGLARA